MILCSLEEFFNLEENFRACFYIVLQLLERCSRAQVTFKAICWITVLDVSFSGELRKKDKTLGAKEL